MESGMIYSGYGYDFLRVPDPDSGKVYDPTGSGFDSNYFKHASKLQSL